MIAFVFRNRITTFICTIAILVLLWYPDFAGYNHTYLSFRLPFTGIENEGGFFDTAGYRMLTIIMAVINGLALMLLSIRWLPFGGANRMVPFFYLAVIFSFPQARAFSTAIPAALVVILGLYALFRSGEIKNPVAPLFISSFLAGCACLLYISSWVVVVCFAVIAVVLHLLYGRNILVFLGGLLFVFGGCLLCRYLFLGDLSDYISMIFTGVADKSQRLPFRTPATLFLTLVFLYLLGRAVARWLYSSYSNKTYKYRVLASIVWMFAICGIPLFFFIFEVMGYLPVLAIPVSMLITYYFSEERISPRKKVEFSVLLLAVALNQIAFFM